VAAAVGLQQAQEHQEVRVVAVVLMGLQPLEALATRHQLHRAKEITVVKALPTMHPIAQMAAAVALEQLVLLV
jgi:hypothetical protein